MSHPVANEMNWLGLVTLLLGFAAYGFGLGVAGKTASKAVRYVSALIFAALAVPAVLFAVYYTGLLGEPIWLYRLRTIRGTELLAGLGGFIAGWAQVHVTPRLRLSAVGRRFLIPVVFGFAISLPYLKPILRPLDSRTLEEKWSGGVSLQSSPSTCGPASAATIVRRLGGNVTERELAREAFTCKSGTENWYLARALRRRGFRTEFLLSAPTAVPLPAIAGVKLKNLGSAGHFIAVLERDGDRMVVADPMEGMSTNTLADLQNQYEFTGFFMVIFAGQ